MMTFITFRILVVNGKRDQGFLVVSSVIPLAFGGPLNRAVYLQFENYLRRFV